MSLNNWTFSGRVGKDAELRTTQSGETVLSFDVANDIGWGDKKKTQWVSCAFWGKGGAAISDYVRQGDKITVVGEVSLEEFRRRDGSPGSKLKVRVSSVDLAPMKERDTGDEYNQDRPPARQKTSGSKPPVHDDLDDEIPF